MKARSVPLFLAVLCLSAASAPAKAPRDVPLTERLVSPNPGIRRQAVEEFHQLPRDKQEEFVPSLMVAMSDEDPGVRGEASALLKELGHAPGQDSDSELSPAAQREKQAARDAERNDALQEIQKEKNAAFGDMQDQINQAKQEQSEIGQGDLRPSRRGSGMSAALLEGLRDQDPWVRARTARKLSLLHPVPAEALPDLIKMLDDDNTEARASAAGALAAMGPAAQSAAPSLLQHVGDPDPAVRQLVAEALHSVQPQHR